MKWYRQDQLILHTLLASVSKGISTYISAATTSRAAWLTLQKQYASSSRSRIINLKDRLTQERQGDRSISAYLQVMRTIAAELELIQSLISDEDLVIHILRGLNSDYLQLAAAVRARDTLLDVESLHDRLIAYEADLVAHRSVTTSNPVTAFSTQRGRGRGRGQGFHNLGSYSQKRHPQLSTYSRGSTSAPQPGLLPTPFTPPFQSASYGRGLGSIRVICQFCDKIGHSAKECSSIQGRPAQVHHTTTAASNNWIIDSAATNHITPDLGNLSLYSDYTGPDEVLVGDGTGSNHGGTAAVRSE